MAEEFLKKGNAELLDEDLEAAYKSYTQGLSVDADHTELLQRRAQVLFTQGKMMESLADANRGLQVDPDHLGLLMRKGRACFSLEEFESALDAFRRGAELEPAAADKWNRWVRKAEAELEAEQEDDKGEQAPEEEPPLKKVAPAPEAAPVPVKVRREWYQTDASVVITLFAKNLQPDQVHVDFEGDGRTMHLRIDDDLYDATLEVQAPVRTADVKTHVFATKVEITLPKTEQVRWNALEGKAAGPLAAAASLPDTDVKPAAVYPTSSRKKQVNWDKLVAEEEEEPQGEEALNKVFKDIFARGSLEQRQAMMKSFTESAGTVLSTNWDEVGKKKVEVSPPDGLEVKSWKQ